jgi:hypothetical protein
VDPIDGLVKLGEALKTGGPWVLTSIAFFVTAYMYRAKEASSKEHAGELKTIHVEHAKAAAERAEKVREEHEKKNEKIVGLVEKLTAVVAENGATIEQFTRAVERLNERRP